jgi:toxin-antitoxin system PIN domain toxin
VILADTNFWLALTLSRHTFHAAARNFYAQQPPAMSFLFCRSTQQSFLRLLTTEAMIRPYGIPPMTNAAAWEVYAGLFTDRRVAWVPEPQADSLEARWKEFALRDSTSRKVWMDAYLAAFAVAGGHELVTTDAAFAQFEGLDPIILLAPKAQP